MFPECSKEMPLAISSIFLLSLDRLADPGRLKKRRRRSASPSDSPRNRARESESALLRREGGGGGGGSLGGRFVHASVSPIADPGRARGATLFILKRRRKMLRRCLQPRRHKFDLEKNYFFVIFKGFGKLGVCIFSLCG